MVRSERLRRKRRWLSISLRASLLLMFLVAIGCGWLGIQMSKLRRQRLAIAKIKAAYGEVAFYHNDQRGMQFVNRPNPGPKLVRKLLGDDFFVRVESVEDWGSFGQLVNGPRLSNIDVLRDLPHLKEVTLYNGQSITDITPLRGLKLNRLTLCRANFKSLDSLAKSTDLKYLDLTESSVVDVEVIERFRKLTSLSLNKTLVESLPSLSQHTRLQTLKLSSTKISDLDFLRSVISLDSLEFSGTRVSDLGPIRNNRKLRLLAMDNTDVSDLEPLRRLRRIEQLSLGRTKVTDIATLARLKELSSLILDFTKVSNVKPLQDLKSLVDLSLIDCPVRHLYLPRSLIFLDISGTEVTDISFLPPNLETLTLDRTDIVDLVPLHRMPDLANIGLGKTQIRDLTPLVRVESLSNIWIVPGCISKREIERFRKLRPEVSIAVKEKQPAWWARDLWSGDIGRVVAGSAGGRRLEP